MASRGRSRYQLLDVLDHGAGGVVHLALDRRTRRFVAAKVLRDPGHDELARLRFIGEQSLDVNHPNVLRNLDWFHGPDEAVLIMELADAGNVSELLSLNGTLPASFVEQATRESLAGLAQLHAAGIVHRDIKPANLMLCSDASSGLVVKVGDLGVAIVEGRPRLTQEARVVGTVGYIPPEVLAGADHDERSDLWALGCTLGALAKRTETPVSESYAHVIASLGSDNRDTRPASATDALAELTDPPTTGVPTVPTVPTVPPVPTVPTRVRDAVRRRRRGRRVKHAASVAGIAAMVLAGAYVGAPRSGNSGQSTADRTQVAGFSVTAANSPTTAATATAAATRPPTSNTVAPTIPETTPTTAPATAAARAASDVLALPRKDCWWYGLTTTGYNGVVGKRVLAWLEQTRAADAFGRGYGYDLDVDALQSILERAALIDDQAGNVATVGRPDDLFAHALLVQWLAAAGFTTPAGTDNTAAIALTATLMAPEQAIADAGLRAADRPAPLDQRLTAFQAILQRFADGGCESNLPKPISAGDDDLKLMFSRPFESLDAFFARLDTARPSIR